ncbi:MAG: 8-oxo-dGTP diphosphatase [Hominenteromicrobium sp.]
MASVEKAVFTNMCMVCDGAGNVLVQDRSDPGWPGIVFPGGHVEPGESFTASVIREVFEETGLTIEKPRLCGVKQFPLDDGARYVVLLYKTDRFSGELRSSEEGAALWLPRAELSKYRLVDSFPEILKVYESDDLGEMFWDTDKDGWVLV